LPVTEGHRVSRSHPRHPLVRTHPSDSSEAIRPALTKPPELFSHPHQVC
jgi:hypothetical protein